MAQLVSISDKLKDMRGFLEKRAAELQAALPKTAQIDAGRFIRVVLTNFQLTPKLLECTKASIYVSMLQAAQFGLELDPVLGHAYLVPYKDRCQLMIGYKGYMVLARRSGEVTSINAKIIHAKDRFEYEDGLERKLIHTPFMGAEEPGPIVGAYVVARFNNGDFAMDVMAKRDIDAIRKRSRASDSGPWVTDYAAMAMKTVIRRAVKFWPTSVEMQQAANLDEQLDTGQDQTFTLDPGDYSIVDEDQATQAAETEPKKLSGLDKLAQATATKDVTPEKKDAPPPPADAPGPKAGEKLPVEKLAAEKPPLPPKPAPPKAEAAPTQDEDGSAAAKSREAAREEVKARHEVPRHQRPAAPRELLREPGEDG